MLCLADSEIAPAEMGTLYHFYKNINGFQPVFSINPKSGVNSGTEFGTRRGGLDFVPERDPQRRID
jgi:hypothetical protein